MPMQVFIFLGRRAQVFIRFSRAFVDAKDLGPLGWWVQPRRGFSEFAGFRSSSVTSRVGLCDFCHLFQLLLPLSYHTVQTVGCQDLFPGPEVAPRSLPTTNAHETRRKAMRVSARLVTGFTANKTLRQARGLCGLSGCNLFSSVTLTAAKCQEKFESECCCL